MTARSCRFAAAACGCAVLFCRPALAFDQPELMAVFSFNPGSFPTFNADLETVPGTPSTTFSGNNALSTPFGGTPFVDFNGNTYPDGNAYGFGGSASWIANEVRTLFDRAQYEVITFSFDYLSTVESGASSGIRKQGQTVYSYITSFPFVGDGQWHRITVNFDFRGDGNLVAGSTAFDIGIGPNGSSRNAELRFDNFQLVGFPEPTAIMFAAPAAMLAGRRRRD